MNNIPTFEEFVNENLNERRTSFNGKKLMIFIES
jgi:hypothetical protein